MSTPLATVGILSIGEMGMGIAKLLIAHNYRVVTNVEGRSAATRSRIESASISTLPTDASLVSASDYILSIVPPATAFFLATRIKTALLSLPTPKPNPLYYLDLNAISPSSARKIESLFSNTPIHLIDGGIIGGPPSLKSPSQSTTENRTTISTPSPSQASHTWSRPSIPLSGPHPLTSAPISGTHLASILNTRHISPLIGPASGLKCCFATTTKGFTALCLQAFTTASHMGVFSELQKEMESRVPGLWGASGGVTTCGSKSGRWVGEMEEIERMHMEDGGWMGDGEGVFGKVADVYRDVESVEKGGEKKGKRTREGVAGIMGEGLRGKRKKVE